MPNKDKTGPLGTGPNGRGSGGCENAQPNEKFGRGQGRGFAGRKFCAMEQGDTAVLEAQIKAQKLKLEAMEKRLAELQK